MDIEYTSGAEELLDVIEPLWEKLRVHHLERTRNYAWHYQAQTFTKRKAALLHKIQQKIKNGKLKVDLVHDQEDGTLVAYCITSINGDNVAELESMYVESCCRSMGVGHRLVERSMEWMTEQGAETRRVIVAAGNEDVLGFYRHFSFYPRSTILEYIPPGLVHTTLADHVTEGR